MRLQALPTGNVEQQLLAYCFATDAVGDVVYVMGAKVGQHYQVTKVNIDNVATMPAVGVIIQKPNATECIVQQSGIVRDIYTGMTPNKPLFVGTNSRLTETRTPNKPTTGRRALQIIGQALSSGDLLIAVKSPIILTT